MFERLLASRSRPRFASPSRWDTLEFDLSGNCLEITLPPQDYEFPEDDNGKRFNLFDPTLYKYNAEPDISSHPVPRKGVSRGAIVRRNWYTYGPVWRAQHIGSLQCAAVICDTSHMPPQLNCFNPEQLERLIIHDLYYNEGPGSGVGSNQYHAPVNWKIKQLHGVEWIYYESWEYKPEWLEFTHATFGCDFVAWLATPLFTDKYLLLTFSATGSFPAEPSNQLMNKRIEQIVPSLKLAFSPEAQKQRAAAQQLFPNAKYSATRAPEAWRYYESYREGDYANAEEPIIFEGPCSPPPELY